jgi:hypothetical protein
VTLRGMVDVMRSLVGLADDTERAEAERELARVERRLAPRLHRLIQAWREPVGG